MLAEVNMDFETVELAPARSSSRSVNASESRSPAR